MKTILIPDHLYEALLRSFQRLNKNTDLEKEMGLFFEDISSAPKLSKEAIDSKNTKVIGEEIATNAINRVKELQILVNQFNKITIEPPKPLSE